MQEKSASLTPWVGLNEDDNDKDQDNDNHQPEEPPSLAARSSSGGDSRLRVLQPTFDVCVNSHRILVDDIYLVLLLFDSQTHLQPVRLHHKAANLDDAHVIE